MVTRNYKDQQICLFIAQEIIATLHFAPPSSQSSLWKILWRDLIMVSMNESFQWGLGPKQWPLVCIVENVIECVKMWRNLNPATLVNTLGIWVSQGAGPKLTIPAWKNPQNRFHFSFNSLCPFYDSIWSGHLVPFAILSLTNQRSSTVTIAGALALPALIIVVS